MLDTSKEEVHLYKDVIKETLEWALKEDLNFIPLKPKSKVSLKAWAEYQDRKITSEEIKEYFDNSKNYNIGILCGSISDNLFVIDCDKNEIFENLFPEDKREGLVIVKTPHGYHVYGKANNPVKPLKCFDKDGAELLTLKAQGGYVVAPGSVNGDGGKYSFVQQGPIERLKGDIREDLKKRALSLGFNFGSGKGNSETVDTEYLLKGVKRGGQDNAILMLSTYLIRQGDTLEYALKVLMKWRERCDPVIPKSEIQEKCETHYRRSEPFSYYFKTNPATVGIKEDLTLEEQTANTSGKYEIPLNYADKDFGVMRVKWHGKELRWEVYRGDECLIIDHITKADFYLKPKTAAQEFGYIKKALKGDFQNFLMGLIPKIDTFIDKKEIHIVEVPTEEQLTEEEREEVMKYLLDPNILDNLVMDLDFQIAGDYKLRMTLLLTAESTYGRNPQNLYIKGMSSSGKSHCTTRVLNYFPEKDVIFLGGLTPKGLFYNYGVEEEINGEMYNVIDFSNKILAVLETPDETTLRNLLSVLAHDRKEITHLGVSKDETGSNVGVKRITRGWPTAIFCTATRVFFTELSTRCLLTAPEVNEEKHRDAIKIQSWNSSHSEGFKLEKNERIKKACTALEYQNQMFRGAEVLISEVEMISLTANNDPRVMRDNPKMLEMIKASARIHAFQRVCLIGNRKGVETKILLANAFDIQVGIELFRETELSTTTGLAPMAIKWYREVFKTCIRKLAPGPSGVTEVSRVELMEHTIKVTGESIGRTRIVKDYLDPLIEAGIIVETGDETHVQRVLYKTLSDIPEGKNLPKPAAGNLEDPVARKAYIRWLIEVIETEHASLIISRGVYIIGGFENGMALDNKSTITEDCESSDLNAPQMALKTLDYIYTSLDPGIFRQVWKHVFYAPNLSLLTPSNRDSCPAGFGRFLMFLKIWSGLDFNGLSWTVPREVI